MRDLGKKYKISSDIRISKNTIRTDTFDKTLWNEELKSLNEPFAKSIDKYKEEYHQFEELNEDLFLSLYKYAPEKNKINEIDYDYLLNNQVIDLMIDTNEYKDLRSSTRLNKEFSYLSTQILSEDSKKIIDKYKEEAKALADELSELEGGAGLPADGDGNEPVDESGNKKGKGANKMSLAEAKELYEKKYEELQNIVPKTERASLVNSIKKAKESAAELQEFIQSFGLEQNNEFIRSSYQDKLALLNKLRNSPKLQKIAKRAGKYRRMAIMSQREKIRRGNNEFVDIETGNDLDKIVPLEFLKLLDDDLDIIFFKNYIEKSLLQSEFGIRERKQEGPVVCCIDSSGSMGGEPEIWAKSVALGLLEICKIQKRSFVAIHFDCSRKEALQFQEFPLGHQNDPNKLIEMAELFLGGGTAFEPPLDLARDKIMQEKNFNKADIIFITDGESAVRDIWLEGYLKWKKEMSVKIHSVVIDVYYASKSTLSEFSDSVTKLSDMREESDLENIAMNLFMST